MATRQPEDSARRLEKDNVELRKALWECRAQLGRLKDLLDRHALQREDYRR